MTPIRCPRCNGEWWRVVTLRKLADASAPRALCDVMNEPEVVSAIQRGEPLGFSPLEIATLHVEVCERCGFPHTFRMPDGRMATT